MSINGSKSLPNRKRKLIFWFLHSFIIPQTNDVSSLDDEMWEFDSRTDFCWQSINFGNVIFYLFQLLLGQNAEVLGQLSIHSTLPIACFFLSGCWNARRRCIFCAQLTPCWWASCRCLRKMFLMFLALPSKILSSPPPSFVLSPSATIVKWTAWPELIVIIQK